MFVSIIHPNIVSDLEHLEPDDKNIPNLNKIATNENLIRQTCIRNDVISDFTGDIY